MSECKPPKISFDSDHRGWWVKIPLEGERQQHIVLGPYSDVERAQMFGENVKRRILDEVWAQFREEINRGFVAWLVRMGHSELAEIAERHSAAGGVLK